MTAGIGDVSALRTTKADVLATVWGCVYAAWAGMKLIQWGATPQFQCGFNWMAFVGGWMSLWELGLGIAVAIPASRRVAALFAVATHVGLVLFAFIAHFRDLDYEGCGCIAVGIEFAWLPWHALFAAALLVPFLAIFVHEERRFRSARTPAAAAPDAPLDAPRKSG